MKEFAQKLSFAIFLMAFPLSVPLAQAQGTAFNYQGQLNSSGSPANGGYDLTFTLYDSTNSPGNIIAGPVTNLNTSVSNGLFSATLDFGAGVFNGSNRWLEIGVRTNGGAGFTTLSPRQALLPMPYAIMAGSASNLLGTLPAAQLAGTVPAGQVSGTFSLAQIPAGVVTNNQSGVILNGNFTGSFSGNGGSLANLSLGALQSGGANNGQVLDWNGSSWTAGSALSPSQSAVLGLLDVNAPSPLLNTLYSFSGPDGATPHSDLVVGQDGNFYGTTAAGGANNQGIIYRLSSSNTLTTLYTAAGG